MSARRGLPAAAVALLLVAVAVGVVRVSGGSDGRDDSGDAAATAGPTAYPESVRVSAGLLAGVSDAGVRSWRGVPYAAAPVGSLRWRPPAPAPSWSGVRPATDYGAPCLQPSADLVYGEASPEVLAGSSEDCLTLNVSRPDDDRADLPVVVWLHGGGFFKGSADGGDRAAGAFVERGVVVVSPNYRLGRLGFFAHPGLEQDEANLGLLDQQAALEWVAREIRAFGGDPDRVTVMGASAGAMSVNALMSMPSAEGLLDAAIAQSAPGDAAAQTLAAARAEGSRAYPGLDADALRALPAADLVSSTFNVLAGDAPIRDAVLPQPPDEVFAAGEEAPVPYLVGSNAEEFSDADLASFGVDGDAVRRELGGADHEALVAAYGRRAYVDDVLDDLVFTAPAAAKATLHAERAPTYRYVFAVGDSGHGAEVPAVVDRTGDPEVADRWAAFVVTGRPDVPGEVSWPEGGAGLLSIDDGGSRAFARDPIAPRVSYLTKVG